jgi:cleavage and polyadenylation specificity factor subunit 2
MDSKLDEGSACLLLNSAPSKVISNEMTVSFLLSLLFSLCIYIKVIAVCLSRLNFYIWLRIFGIFQVQVKCSLAYMDFEGRTDGRSVKSVIAHVAPLKLVRVFSSNFIS